MDKEKKKERVMDFGGAGATGTATARYLDAGSQAARIGDVKAIRERLGEGQALFWRRFGITQWAGSRYEKSRRAMGEATRVLIVAFAQGDLEDSDLNELLTATRDGQCEDGDRGGTGNDMPRAVEMLLVAMARGMVSEQKLQELRAIARELASADQGATQ